MSRWLVCPSCAAEHVGDERLRFCPACGFPLVHADVDVEAEYEPDAIDRRARRIERRYTDGPLVAVGWARHQAEAELVQGLLSEAGIPSMLRRSRGFDVPDMLAAGPRDVLVPESGVEVARQVLLQHDLAPAGSGVATDPPWRVLAWLSGALVVVALIAWAGTELLA